jgi:hypothetical protein
VAANVTSLPDLFDEAVDYLRPKGGGGPAMNRTAELPATLLGVDRDEWTEMLEHATPWLMALAADALSSGDRDVVELVADRLGEQLANALHVEFLVGLLAGALICRDRVPEGRGRAPERRRKRRRR